MLLIRKKLSADELSPTSTRYNPETDTVESTPDGGVTWNENPALDPRHNDAARLPARTGGTAQCDAAEAMKEHLRAQVDAFLTSATIFQLVTLFTPLLAFIPGINVLALLLFEIASALFTIGTVVVEAAMTETVYDQLKCILLCNIGADGQMSAAQLEATYADVDDQIGGTAATVIHEITRAWGEVGFSNAGASGEYTGDCEACDCGWTRCWLSGDGLGDWITPWVTPASATSAGFYNSGDDTIEGTLKNLPDTMWANFALFEALDITGILITFDYVNSAPLGDNGFIFWGNDGQFHDGLTPEGSGTAEASWEGDGSGITSLEFLFASSGSITITQIKLAGTGTPPATGTDCE